MTDDSKIRLRLKGLFETLLNPIITAVEDQHRDDSQGGKDISAAELIEAMKLLKSGKTAGIDEIRKEIFKSIGNGGMKWMLRICQTAWQLGKITKD